MNKNMNLVSGKVIEKGINYIVFKGKQIGREVFVENVEDFIINDKIQLYIFIFHREIFNPFNINYKNAITESYYGFKTSEERIAFLKKWDKTIKKHNIEQKNELNYIIKKEINKNTQNKKQLIQKMNSQLQITRLKKIKEMINMRQDALTEWDETTNVLSLVSAVTEIDEWIKELKSHNA